jgi:plastocyanin
MTRTTLVSFTGVVALAVASCGSSAGGPRTMAQTTAQAGPAAAAVNIQTFQFQPGDLTVRAGTRVTWTNRDQITHTVTSGTPENRDQRFNAPLAGQGTTFAHTFAQAGTYPYFCDRHQSMRGTVRVN